jgi:hypothetical protein
LTRNRQKSRAKVKAAKPQAPRPEAKASEQGAGAPKAARRSSRSLWGAVIGAAALVLLAGAAA